MIKIQGVQKIFFDFDVSISPLKDKHKNSKILYISNIKVTKKNEVSYFRDTLWIW